MSTEKTTTNKTTTKKAAKKAVKKVDTTENLTISDELTTSEITGKQVSPVTTTLPKRIHTIIANEASNYGQQPYPVQKTGNIGLRRSILKKPVIERTYLDAETNKKLQIDALHLRLTPDELCRRIIWHYHKTSSPEFNAATRSCFTPDYEKGLQLKEVGIMKLKRLENKDYNLLKFLIDEASNYQSTLEAVNNGVTTDEFHRRLITEYIRTL